MNRIKITTPRANGLFQKLKAGNAKLCDVRLNSRILEHLETFGEDFKKEIISAEVYGRSLLEARSPDFFQAIREYIIHEGTYAEPRYLEEPSLCETFGDAVESAIRECFLIESEEDISKVLSIINNLSDDQIMKILESFCTVEGHEIDLISILGAN